MKELSLEYPDGRVLKLPPQKGCLLILDTLIADLDRDGWSAIVEAGSGELVTSLAGLTRTLGFPDPPLIVRRSVDQAVACLGYDACWREHYERVSVEFREPYGGEVQTLVVVDPQNGCYGPMRGCGTWGTGGNSHCVLWDTLNRWRKVVATLSVEQLGQTDETHVHLTIQENYMGDVFRDNPGATIVNRSKVDGSFNKDRRSREIANALIGLTELVVSSRNEAASASLEDLKAELAKQRPEKSRLEKIGAALIQALPTISAVASLVKTIVSCAIPAKGPLT